MGKRPLFLLLRSDLLPLCIPHGRCLLEVGVVRQVAAEGGVVAEDLVFHRTLPGPHGVDESRHVVGTVAVAARRRIGFGAFLLGGVAETENNNA